MSGNGTTSTPPPPPTSPLVAPSYRQSLQSRMVFSAFLVFFVALVLFVCCCAARNSRRRNAIIAIIPPAAYAAGGGHALPSPGTGLSEKALRALPVHVYLAAAVPASWSRDCPVCLEEFKEGERWKLIPSCGHGFHVGCIDMWLHSHSTCPVCRTVVNSEFSGQSTAIV